MSEDVTAPDRAALRAVAEAALHDNDGEGWVLDSSETGPYGNFDIARDSLGDAVPSSGPDHRFVATFDPPTITALLDDAEHLKAENVSLRERLAAAEAVADWMSAKEADMRASMRFRGGAYAEGFRDAYNVCGAYLRAALSPANTEETP